MTDGIGPAQTGPQWAAAGEVRAQKFHLIGEDVAALQVDVLGMGGGVGDSQQYHQSRPFTRQYSSLDEGYCSSRE